MNRKISRNKKYKYSNEEKLALLENVNTSVLTNIDKGDEFSNFRIFIEFSNFHLKMF